MKRLRIPPILPAIIQTTLSACNGLLFDQYRSCPACGAAGTGYDRKEKIFAILTDGQNRTKVTVFVKRFRCSGCGKMYSAQAPFYEDTRTGSPIVDLCVILGQAMPFSRVSSTLEFLGIHVDRWTVRNYVLENRVGIVAATELYGIRVPLSLVNLTGLVANSGDNQPLVPQEVLAACGLNPDIGYGNR